MPVEPFTVGRTQRFLDTEVNASLTQALEALLLLNRELLERGFGCGRCGECKELTLRNGKGGMDRRTLIPESHYRWKDTATGKERA